MNDRSGARWTEAQIADAALVIPPYKGVSKPGDALGVELEPMFEGVNPKLHVTH